MEMISFHSFYTLIAFIAFIGICIWAWSKKRKKYFSEAEQLPFADDDIAEKSVHALEQEIKHE